MQVGKHMSHTKESRNRAYSRLNVLEDRYGYIRPIHVTWKHSNENFEWIVNRLQNGTLRDSGVWIRDRTGKILLVNEPEFPGWKEPNTEVKPTESFEAGARQIATDLLNQSVQISSLIEVQIIKNVTDGHFDGPIYGVIAIFEGAIDQFSPAVSMTEGTAEWFSSPPENTINEHVSRRGFS